MRCLILGSFPPHADRRVYPFYYPTVRNRFWKILSEIAEIPLVWTKIDKEKAVQERFAIMKKLTLGVQNLGLEIDRKAKSALDTNIRITKYQNIISIIENHPELTSILLPGFSAVHSTARSFLNYIQLNGIESSHTGPLKAESSFKISFKGRSLSCVVLNSTSTASKVNFAFLLDQFRRNLK